jgi:signal transduction histidine kinase
MWRGAVKLLLWSLCVALGMMASGGVLDACFIVALLMSVSVSAFSEWCMPRWYVALPTMGFVLASIFFPVLVPFLPLLSCDVGALFGDRQRQSDMYRDARALQRLRILRWLVYCMWLASLAVCLVRRGNDDLGLRAVIAVSSLIAFGLGLMMASLRIASLRLVRVEDARMDALRRIHTDKLDMEAERSRSVQHATLLERTRIAREIHDSVGHLLTRGIMQAHAERVLAQSAGDASGANAFEALEGTIAEAMTMLRESVHDLDEQGNDFIHQIEVAAHSLDMSQGNADVDAGGPPDALQVRLENGIDDAPVAVTRCFAMSIREALNNTLRHSAARRVDVVLRDMPALWQLVVQDDGGGHTMHGRSGREMLRTLGADGLRNDHRGMGLADIDSRARELGGSSLCGPYAGGWRVFVSIPKPAWRGGIQSRTASEG